MKRIIALVLAVLMMAAIFVGCAKGGDDNNNNNANTNDDPFYGEDNITLKVWAPDAAVSLTEKMCADFIDQYPDKTISIEVVAQGESDAASAILNDPEAAADVFGFACDQLNKLTDAGVLSPVYADYLDDVTARNSASSVEAGTIDGILYAYPETGDNGYYLVYDKSVVSDDDAKTLEGVLAACRAAGRKFIMNAGTGFYSCVYPFTGGLAIEGFEGEENDVQKFNDYDEDEVVATLMAFATLFQDYSDIFEDSDPANISSGFATDPRTVAAGVDGSWNASTVASYLGDDFGAVKLPTINVNGEDKQMISMHGFKLIGVNGYTAFPEASQLLANYLSDYDCQMQRVTELSWGPSNTEAASSDEVTSNVAITAILDQSNYSIPQVNIAPTFWDPMANLGNQLYKEAKYTTDVDATKELLDKTIKNIKDQ